MGIPVAMSKVYAIAARMAIMQPLRLSLWGLSVKVFWKETRAAGEIRDSA